VARLLHLDVSLELRGLGLDYFWFHSEKLLA